MEHITIYKDPDLYVAFPSSARLANGDVLVSFREAGQFGAERASRGRHTHLDAQTRVCLVRSWDRGDTCYYIYGPDNVRHIAGTLWRAYS